ALEAKMISDYGYTDKAGFRYGAPSTSALVQKTLGFTPADEANYEEKEQTVSGIEAREEYDKSNIQTHLAKAFNRQDPAMYQSWLQDNQSYMLTHPGLEPPAMSF